MNKYIFLILISIFCEKITAQNIVSNGDFEINTAGGCLFNLSNSTFNLKMNECFAFGSNSELDIQDHFCSSGNYSGDIPAHGLYFISLSTSSFTTDALSLVLDTTLISGHQYYVSYYEKANTVFSNVFNDSLLIGVSSDSSVFGTQIFSSLPTVQAGWIHKTFTFISPLDGKYLTFSNKGEQNAWNFIDNICLSSDSNACVTPVNIIEMKNKDNITLFPNPFMSEIGITVHNNEFMEIVIYDLVGNCILHKSFRGSTLFNTDNIPNGFYYYVIKTKDGIVKKGKVLKRN